MNITQKQGLQYKKLLEGFSSAIGAPKTTEVNNEDLTNLENLKRQFESAVSDYSSLQQLIADNARNYVGLKTKSNQEYKDYINRNIVLSNGSKYHITNSGVAKKYSDSAWENRHSSCRHIDDDPRTINVNDEDGLKSHQPSILLGTPMQEGEPCGKGYQNIEVNIPMHDDPKMMGCYYNSSSATEDRNIIAKDETALKPDEGESIIGTGKTFEECRIEALKQLKKFFSLTSLDENNKGTCIASNNSDSKLLYDRFGKAQDENENALCSTKDSQGYFIGRPQKCKQVPDVCQPRKYEQIKEYYDCDVDDAFGNPNRAWTDENMTTRIGSSVLPAIYYARITIKSNNSRWAATRQLKHIKMAYDNLAEKFSEDIEFTGYVPKDGTFTKTVEVPFERENTEVFGISIYIGRDGLDADWIQIEVSFDNENWRFIGGGDDEGKVWSDQFFTKYDDYFTIRTDKEFSLETILPQGEQTDIKEGKWIQPMLMWSPLDVNSSFYNIRLENGESLISGIVITGNVQTFTLHYKNNLSNNNFISYNGAGNSSVKQMTPEYNSNNEATIYLDYPIVASLLSFSSFTTTDGDRPKMAVDIIGTPGIEARNNKVNFEGYYSAIGAQSAQLSTNVGEKTFEECIASAAKLNVSYFGIYGFNPDTQKVNCFFPSNNEANPSANDFYMAGYEERWNKISNADAKKYSGASPGFELGADNENVAIYTTNAECKERPKDGKPIDCPTNTIYYSTANGLTDQCCTVKDDCDAGYSTVYSTEITDSSTMGNKGYIDRDNILHPYVGLNIDETDSSCPKTDVASVTGELWSKFNMGTNMTKERTCGIAQLSKEERRALNTAEDNLRSIATTIDQKIENAYQKNIRLNDKNNENKSEFNKNFEEYKKQYKKVKSQYSKKIQTMYEDLELKHTGDFVQIAGMVALTGLVIGGGIYYLNRSKPSAPQS